MILQFFRIFLLLWLPINALTQSTSSAKPDCISISFRLPFSIEANKSCCVNKWFATSYISSAGKSLFIENIDLDVLEFSLGGARRGYGVKYCQTAGVPFKILNESLGNKDSGGGRLQECKYALFADRWEINSPLDVQDWRKLRQLFNWRLGKFCVDVFAIDANSSSRNFPVLEWNCIKRNTRLRLEENVDESKDIPKAPFRESMNYKNFTHNRFSKPRFSPVIGATLGGIFLLMGRSWLRIIIRKTKKIKLRKFFKRNGGLLLQQMVNSYDGSVDRCKPFSEMELEKATDHFNVNRILGQGGQGTVYKGMLEDGRIIAVKKSKVVEEEKLEEFVNELVILSQINHRNVVKLLGCCLETEVPLLVYEFIANGTLFQFIHNRNEELPLTWKMRLRIATEVAGAVSYLHSAAAIPIYHRDIKSTNILLDNKYRAKVGDFGTSKFIASDQTHVSTVVLGTLGYLDPEYYQSSQLTDKSDVYSFGVVLVELLTGEKPIFSTTSQENINLAKYFVHAMKENRLYDILDGQVKQMGRKAEIMAFANLAKRCLNTRGKERPTMKEVATELEGIRALEKKKAVLSKFMKIFSK